MPKKDLKALSSLVNVRPQRAAKSAAIKSLVRHRTRIDILILFASSNLQQDCLVPLNVKMRNYHNTVWSNTIVKAEVEESTKKVERSKKKKLQPIVVEKTAEPKEEPLKIGDKENKAKKPLKIKLIGKRRPDPRSSSVTREPLAVKKMALKTGKSRAASES